MPTIGEVVLLILGIALVGALMATLVAESQRNKVTWAGRIGALLFIPAGVAMAEGHVPGLVASLVAMGACAWIDRRAARRQSAGVASAPATAPRDRG